MPVAAGKLEVRLLKGKDLTSKDRFGKQDPYAKLFLGKKGERGVERKSKTILKGGNDVSWQEIFMYETTGEDEVLTVHVLDEDKGVLADDRIGSVEIDLQEFINNSEQPTFYTLLDDGKDQGSVSLSCKYTPYIPGQLYVQLHKGQDLKDKDIGKQDPYVVFQIDDGEKKKSTVIKKGGRNPEWDDEKVAFEIKGNEKWLVFKVYDEDVGSDDFIAGARFDLRKAGLAEKKETGEMVIKLGQGEHFDKKKGGNLVVSMSFVAAE